MLIVIVIHSLPKQHSLLFEENLFHGLVLFDPHLYSLCIFIPYYYHTEFLISHKECNHSMCIPHPLVHFTQHNTLHSYSSISKLYYFIFFQQLCSIDVQSWMIHSTVLWHFILATVNSAMMYKGMQKIFLHCIFELLVFIPNSGISGSYREVQALVF